MSLRALNSLERGEAVNPHYATLTGIADALGMSISELLGEPEPVGKAQAPPESGEPEEERRKRERSAILQMRDAARQAEEITERARDDAEGFPFGAIGAITQRHAALKLFFKEAAAARKPPRELDEAWRGLDVAYTNMGRVAGRDTFPETELDRASSRARARRWEEAQHKRAASEGTPDALSGDAG
jgi:transcriptional regulator with XRE-family HTH domain